VTLTGEEIKKNIEAGLIGVTPFDPVRVGANSIDMTLADELKVYVDREGRPLDLVYAEALHLHPQDGGYPAENAMVRSLERRGAILDVREPPRTRRVRIPDDGIVLLPGRGYLARTAERVSTDHFVAHMHGRSSVGRLFVSVHQTAGWGDVGFAGTWTMEITVIHPVRVYAGMAIAQLAFDKPLGERTLYGERRGSKYQDQREPEESRLYWDFKGQEE